jgi:hypothetical protein
VESIRAELERTLAGVGRVSRMGPVQVTEVEEKPGALLVRWEEVCCVFTLLWCHGKKSHGQKRKGELFLFNLVKPNGFFTYHQV